MPKFYVQSGQLEMVLQARDTRCAAIWAAHRTLSQTLPFLCESESSYAMLADLTQLGPGRARRVAQLVLQQDLVSSLAEQPA